MRHLFFVLLILTGNRAIYAQNLAYAPQMENKSVTKNGRDDGFYKPKPISYTALGYLAPLDEDELIIGGTSAVYKRFGTFLAYKVGLKNYTMPEGEKGDLTYLNVKDNGWTITSNSQKAVTFMLSTGLTFAIWKKMPIYVGAGFTRYRYFFEYLDPFDNNKPKWNVNSDKTGFQINYTAGFMVPLFSRVILNVGYDYNPKSIFIGIGIRGKDVYKDMDDWN